MKRLAGFSVLAVVMVGITLSAQETAAPTTHPYYPIKVGSEWTYKVQGGPIKMKITGPEKVGTNSGFKIEVSAGNKVSATEVIGVTKDGVVRYSVNNVAADAPILFLPTDPDTTKEWTIDTKGGGQALKGKFTASKEKVTVPAGTYDTIHVKGADMTVGSTTSNIDYWFAKDIGIVKLKFTLGSQEAVLELESYTPGK
ncbi:MAG TPA: hypothetical protein VHR66_31515 [Gemmataceae bacterium]|jgi:hypothetical protein|nr:hypothetical protein [Gemmataceae bacterium]